MKDRSAGIALATGAAAKLLIQPPVIVMRSADPEKSTGGDHAGWRVPMINQQPWIASHAHDAMHQPAGPEVTNKLA